MELQDIPQLRPDGTAFSRPEREGLYRQLKSSLRWSERAHQLGIPMQLAYGVEPIYVLHALLDEEVKKKIITGDRLGLKLDEIQTRNPQALQAFESKLVIAVQSGQAMAPNQGDGLVSNQTYAPPPPPPPPSAPSNGAGIPYPPPAPAAFQAPPPPPPPPGYGQPVAAPMQQAPAPPPVPQYQQPVPQAAPPPPPQYQAAPVAPPPPPPPPQMAAGAPPPPPPAPPAPMAPPMPQQMAPPPPPVPQVPQGPQIPSATLPPPEPPQQGKRRGRGAQAAPPAPPVPGVAPLPPTNQGYAPVPVSDPMLGQIVNELKELRAENKELRGMVQILARGQALGEFALSYVLRRAWHEAWAVNPQTGQTDSAKAAPQSMEDFKLEPTLRSLGFQDQHLPPR